MHKIFIKINATDGKLASIVNKSIETVRIIDATSIIVVCNSGATYTIGCADSALLHAAIIAASKQANTRELRHITEVPDNSVTCSVTGTTIVIA
jgi:hypothetical protein